MVLTSLCYCGSQHYYTACCGVFIESRKNTHPHLPKTPEQLMRSRFTAYVLNNADYILATEHFSRHDGYEYERLNTTFQQVRFIGLQILHAEDNFVTFCAYFVENKPVRSQGIERMIECSRFVQVAVDSIADGQVAYPQRIIMDTTSPLLKWVYIDGITPTQRQPCVCGSGKKFKHCCLKKLDETTYKTML